jgi:hypothetical protein
MAMRNRNVLEKPAYRRSYKRNGCHEIQEKENMSSGLYVQTTYSKHKDSVPFKHILPTYEADLGTKMCIKIYSRCSLNCVTFYICLKMDHCFKLFLSLAFCVYKKNTAHLMHIF